MIFALIWGPGYDYDEREHIMKGRTKLEETIRHKHHELIMSGMNLHI